MPLAGPVSAAVIVKIVIPSLGHPVGSVVNGIRRGSVVYACFSRPVAHGIVGVGYSIPAVGAGRIYGSSKPPQAIVGVIYRAGERGGAGSGHVHILTGAVAQVVVGFFSSTITAPPLGGAVETSIYLIFNDLSNFHPALLLTVSSLLATKFLSDKLYCAIK